MIEQSRQQLATELILWPKNNFRFPKKIFSSKVLSNFLTMRLTCVSQYQAVGCPWSGKLKDLASHTKKCPHKTTEAEKLDLLIKTG